MKKRIIGIFLAVAMLVPAVFTVSASAASQSELPQALLLYTGFTRMMERENIRLTQMMTLRPYGI